MISYIKAIVMSTVLFCSLKAAAQKGKAEAANTSQDVVPLTSNSLFDVHFEAYRNAMKYFDLQAASVALYTALALKPERTDLNDTLAYLYFTGERYAQSYLIGEDILKKNANRNDIREIVAVSKQSLNMLKESLADYETLYKATKDLQYLYQIAAIQYQLKRYGECIASVDQIIADPASAQQNVSLRIQDGGSQNVIMKAAAHNIKGICAMEVNQNDAALDNFKKALEIFPDFILAKNNMNFLNQQTQQKSAESQGKGQQPSNAPKK